MSYLKCIYNNMMLITLLINWGGFVAIARRLSWWLRKLDLNRYGILNPINPFVIEFDWLKGHTRNVQEHLWYAEHWGKSYKTFLHIRAV